MPQYLLFDVIRPSFFTKYAASGNVRHLADMFNFLLKIGAFCVFPLAAGMFVLGDKMVSIIFKADYLPGLPILWVLVTFAAINIVAPPTGLVLQAIERVEINLYSKIFAVYNLIAELIVVQWFGVMGVVLVTCSAVLMKNMFSYYFVRKYTAMSVDWRSLCVIATNAFIMAMVLWPLRAFVVDFLSLSLVSCLGILIYSLSAWLNKAFSSRERDWINRIVPHPVFVF
jgi:O-antigen/teichoic acid export membrane protein